MAGAGWGGMLSQPAAIDSRIQLLKCQLWTDSDELADKIITAGGLDAERPQENF